MRDYAELLSEEEEEKRKIGFSGCTSSPAIISKNMVFLQNFIVDL